MTISFYKTYYEGKVGMGYKPIEVKKIYEEVADAILLMIKKGQLQPGDKLESVEQLAENFSVSRSTIREALSGLRAMGLVKMRQGEGTFVTTFDPASFSLPVSTAFLMKKEDVKELYEVRKIVEVGAASLAASNRTEADLKVINATLEAMKSAKEKGDINESADFRFHLAIAAATHNDMLINLLGSISDIMAKTIKEARKLLLIKEYPSDLLISEHELIYKAIKNKQPDEAHNHMLNHLVAVEQLLFKYVRV